MNPSTRTEVLNETDQGQVHRGNPNTVLEQSCSKERARSPKPVVPFVLDGDAFETFVDGAGI